MRRRFQWFYFICHLIFIMSTTSSIRGEKVISSFPNWVSAPGQSCSKSEICSLGEGANLNQAMTNAREGIQKVFETEITSRFSSSSASSNNEVDFERLQSELTELTNGILKGAEIKHTYQGGHNVFALATLNKLKLGSLIFSEIKKLDEKIDVLMKDKHPYSSLTLGELYKKRESLAYRYEFLVGKKLRLSYSYKEIFDKVRAAYGKILVQINIEGDDSEKVLSTVSHSLTDLGIQVLGKTNHEKSGSQNKQTHFLQLKIKSEKEYLNVRGFEKYNVQFLATLKNKEGLETSSLNYEVVETGRDQRQCLLRALPEIQKYITLNMKELNWY